LGGTVYVAFRDMNAPDTVPNTWLNRHIPGLGWQGWELLNLPSYLTPGIALAPDNRAYLLYAPSTKTTTSTFIGLRLASRAVDAIGGDFDPVWQVGFPSNEFGQDEISTTE